MLGDNPLQVARAGELVERTAALGDVLRHEHRRRRRRYERGEHALPLEQRPVAQVVAVELEDIEGAEHR